MSHPGLAEILGGLPGFSPISIVDVGASPLTGTKGPYQRLVDSGQATLVGFEPGPESFQQLQEIKAPGETYLPVAVGDGATHQMRMCSMPGMNSLLEPNFAMLDLLHYHGMWAQVKEVVEINTVRLDDVEEVRSMDYLKIDIQGGELMVFQSARERLKDCLVVHSELMFVPLYVDQPLFSEQELFLRQFGLQVHKFIELYGHVLKPLVVNGDGHAPLSQVFWSDVVFIKDITRLDRLLPEQLLKLAVILHDVYASVDVVHLVLSAYDRAVGTTIAAKYLAFFVSNAQIA